MINISKFDNMATDYAKYRPSYANACIDYLLEQIATQKDSTIADIGSGTGKLSMLLLEKGATVLGIEPNQDMRRQAEQRLQGYANFKSINASAENTTLKNKSIDLITVAQAFHWFNQKEFQKECIRILKPDGLVAILYNHGDYNQEVIRVISALSKKYCPLYKGSSGGLSNQSPIFQQFFESYTTETFPNNYPLTLEQFVGLNFSASYAPKKEDANYQIYLEKLIDIFTVYNKEGILTMPNNTICRLGKVKVKTYVNKKAS